MRRTPLCFSCKHLNDGEQIACKAFAVIPEDILFGRFDHRQPHPGDNGIQYEPIDGSDEEDET